MKKEFLTVILLLLFSFPAVKELLLPGGFTSHDLTHHVIRQITMDKLLSEGQFPPRWSGELNSGFGYPVFLFNYPFPALLGEFFYILGFDFVSSVKAVLLTSMLMSSLGMYLFLRSLLGLKLAAFLGSLFYLYAPIRFLTVYVSAAVGGALGLGFVPFIFWLMVELSKDSSKWKILVGAGTLALLILSHNVTTIIFTPIFLIFGGILIWNSNKKIRLFKNLIGMFLLGFGLSAWFWIPAWWEKQYIIFDQIYGSFFKDQFVTIGQLIYSPWGFGLSHPQNPGPGDMSYQLGLAHIGVMFIFSFWFFLFGRKTKDKILTAFVLVGFILSIFLMLKISSPLWENLSFLSLVQFPLRFEAVSIFMASMAVALLIKYLPFRKLLFIVLLFLVIYANRNHWHINQVFIPGEDYYLSLKTTTSSNSEHLPKWGNTPDKPPIAKFEFIEGGGKMSEAPLRVKIEKDKSAKVLAQIEASVPSKLKFNQFYFPGWVFKVDQKEVDFNYLTKENYGLPVLNIDTGSHQILAEFTDTFDRKLAGFISLISLAILGILAARYAKIN